MNANKKFTFKDPTIIAAIIGGVFLLIVTYIQNKPSSNLPKKDDFRIPQDDSKIPQKVFWLPDNHGKWSNLPGIVAYPQNETIMWPRLKEEIDSFILTNLDNYFIPKKRRIEFDSIANTVKIYNLNDSDVAHVQFGWNAWLRSHDSIIRVTSPKRSSLQLYGTFVRFKGGKYQMIAEPTDTGKAIYRPPYKDFVK